MDTITGGRGRIMPHMPIKLIIIALLGLILASLFSALFFMYKDPRGSRRTAKALTVRIVLSIVLFLFLMAAFYFGLIPGMRPQ